MEKAFMFASTDAIEIAYIVKRNESDKPLLHEFLVFLAALERAKKK